METPSGKALIKKIFVGLGALAILLLILSIALYSQKNKLIQASLNELNTTLTGKVVIEEAVLSPFAQFPYISIDLKKLEIHETKEITSDTVLFIEDAYVGLDLLAILQGNYEIKKIKLENGFLRVVQFEDGSFNASNAFLSTDSAATEESESSEALNFQLDKLDLVNIDLLKINQSSKITVEAFIEKATAGFKSTQGHIEASLNSQFIFNLINDQDTSFLHDKHVMLSTSLDFDTKEELLNLDTSRLIIEKAEFFMVGAIDIANNFALDLDFGGRKPNFDLFLAFAPPELEPVLNRYSNGGNVFFDASVDGPSINGYSPSVAIKFGCKEAFVKNTIVEKEVNELYFEGYFTNGEERNATSSRLVIEDFRARPETGRFEADLIVENFESPDINMQVDADFNLDFLTSFFNLDMIENTSGKIALQMNFHDIIDLDDPSKAIERLNESYFTTLSVQDLSFTSPDFHLPFTNINLEAVMDGHKANISTFEAKVGNSDLSLSASISDLPAIIHHTDLPVTVDMRLKSSLLD
ncbi:MAG: hypothetical protein AAF789_04420, partial [Bacteroidota bacterium]